MNTEKFKGVFPAFYACYDDNGEISAERTQLLAKHLMEKGVKGLYVGGSSGECIYQSVEDRKKILENVMKAVKGKLTIIAHVACNNTRTAVNWQHMRKARELMQLRLFHRFIFIFRSMQLQNIGMIFQLQHQIHHLLFTIFRSYLVLHLLCHYIKIC